MNGPEPTREQRQQLVDSERAELAGSIDELSRRISPAALLGDARERAQQLVVPVGAALVAVALLLVLGRRARRRRHAAGMAPTIPG